MQIGQQRVNVYVPVPPNYIVPCAVHELWTMGLLRARSSRIIYSCLYSHALSLTGYFGSIVLDIMLLAS
jgi:hypothetical protein